MASQSSAMSEVGHRGFVETSMGAADKSTGNDKQDTADSDVMSIDKLKLLELKAKLSAADGEGGPHGIAELSNAGTPAKRKSPARSPVSPPKCSTAMASGPVVEMRGKKHGQATPTAAEKAPAEDLWKSFPGGLSSWRNSTYRHKYST